MDKILAQREKYFSSIPEKKDTKEKFRNFISQLDQIKYKNYDQLADQNKIIDDLNDKNKRHKDKLSIEEQKLNCLLNDFENLIDPMEELGNELKFLVFENLKDEFKKNEMKSIKPSPRDKQILECRRKKLKYYKDLTGIAWNYSTIKNCTAGFVSNGRDYIQSFCLDKNDKKTEIKLWKEISKCAGSHVEKISYD
ncbi:uncharacterized protein LOC128667281 [Microplitis demolitor]|uniref:uncharacterized protein LOC128667281 n=1 Tax=Microplitis demolitor TaxID=69319 RepID=UPI00235B66A9|nr:uncharacterized protein LOC128667281 [Microplitis demolitor]